MPARLALCDLGAPGWGEPWFPHSAVLLYSHLGMAMSVMFVFSVLPLLYLPYQYKRWYKDITLTHCRCYTTGLPATFPFSVCFVLCVLVCFACVFFLWFGFVFRFLFCDGIVTAFWTCIGPPPVYFCGHSISRRPSLRQLINSLISATCNRTCWTTWRKPRGVGRKKNLPIIMGWHVSRPIWIGFSSEGIH